MVPEKDKDLLAHIHIAEPSETKGDVDVATLEKARFLYQGPASLKGLPVFYVIFNRLLILVFFIITTMQSKRRIPGKYKSSITSCFYYYGCCC